MTSRFLIIIPVYNHPKTIVDVVRSCLEWTDFPILIVDDGSTPSIQEIFRGSDLSGGPKLNLVDQNRIQILTHEVNKGKGAALQSGFSWAIQKQFTHAITLDADGQHFPEDIPKLVKKSIENPWALILGDREMSGPHIPESSIFGKKFSNFWVQFETHQKVGDSQSGFRIYPLFQIQNISFLSTHYDFEVEVLTRLLWKNIKIENVKIQVQYQQGTQRVTHFDKWKDNARLTLLNTMLVTMSLIRAQKNSFKNSLALGLGVLVGTTPFYGFHTLIVIILSLMTRLNVVILWMGSHISMPPFIPFLILSTKVIYNKIYGESIEITHFSQVLDLGFRWVLSSLILGSGLGFLAFGVSYIIQKTMQKNSETIASSNKTKKSTQKWSKKSHAHLGILFIRKLMDIAGIRAAYLFLYLVVPFYFINLRVRRSLNEYWKTIRPNINYLQRQKEMFHQLLSFAQNLVDRAFQRNSKKYSLQMHKDDSLQTFVDYMENPENKRPCILISTHFGGWELAMTAFNNIKTNKKMLVVMHDAGHGQEHQSTSLMDREKFEIMYFNKENFSILKIKEYLSRGDIIGLMGDRPVGRSYELVTFFNKLCVFDSTAFRLAELLKADIFYLFCTKEDILSYRVAIHRSEIASTPTANFETTSTLEERQQRIRNNMREYTQLLESFVEKNPEQWMNFYPFFSSYPQDLEH